MAEGGDDGQEKTEDPSQKRLDKAKEDGEVLSSKELQVFMTMSMGVALIYALYVFLPPRMGHWIAFFEFGDLNQLNSYIMSRIGDAMAIFIVISAIVGLPIMLTVLATQGALSGGINFAVKSMHFKGNRINPLSGFKRMFSINGLMELAKAVAKVLLLTAAFATVIWLILPVLLNLLSTNLNSALSEAFSALMLALGASLIVLAIIAGIDVAYAIHKHTKKLKMSPRNLKMNISNPRVHPRLNPAFGASRWRPAVALPNRGPRLSRPEKQQPSSRTLLISL